MSTKLRVIVQVSGQKPIKGSQAIGFICNEMRKRLFKMVLPIGWEQMRIQQKLEFMMQHLPSNVKLILIRERKWTRRSKSLYIKMLKLKPSEMAPAVAPGMEFQRYAFQYQAVPLLDPQLDVILRGR